ncbi:MAG: virulence protein RhuM/Fic/DOC family protein [Candidatus Pacebacteria bacterium]|nr:virulence protein RhuM/Fic/DOC family protein [Candidatus Paceibacterota bacterium]
MKKETQEQRVVVYQTKNGAIELRGDIRAETVWATQTQIVQLFGVDQSVVSRHIRNVIRDGEVDPKSNMQKMHIAGSDKPVALYSLDVILSVGYRTNSKIAIEFRKWATKNLREHITKGYTLNRKRIAQNYDAFMRAVGDMQALLPEAVALDPKDVLELVKKFADTWVSLQAYDTGSFTAGKPTKKRVLLTAQALSNALVTFKEDLVSEGGATDLFARERETGSVSGIVGNVMQSFGGKDMYPSVEAKAAHLLYFMVKNHPFADGNKRSGAFTFVWFLRKARVLDVKRMTPAALTALTLLIAESDPNDKDKMTALTMMLLGRNA